MKTRFSDDQIIQMIKEQEAGEKTADIRAATPCHELSDDGHRKTAFAFLSFASPIQLSAFAMTTNLVPINVPA